MRLIVAGSRGWTDDKRIHDALYEYCQLNFVTEIITGGAHGVDTIAHKWAVDNGFATFVIRPDYDKYGKRAPLVRNDEMAKRGDALIAFQLDRSTGTAHMISCATKRGLQVKIYKRHTEGA